MSLRDEVVAAFPSLRPQEVDAVMAEAETARSGGLIRATIAHREALKDALGVSSPLMSAVSLALSSVVGDLNGETVERATGVRPYVVEVPGLMNSVSADSPDPTPESLGLLSELKQEREKAFASGNADAVTQLNEQIRGVEANVVKEQREIDHQKKVVIPAFQKRATDWQAEVTAYQKKGEDLFLKLRDLKPGTDAHRQTTTELEQHNRRGTPQPPPFTPPPLPETP